MRRKAKFKVGQVVAFRRKHPMRPETFGKIRVIVEDLYNVDGWTARAEELRPLTARERGSSNVDILQGRE